MYRPLPSKRIVFLDIDGPFVTLRSTIAGLKSDPVSVAAVNEFLQLPNTWVVIASVERKLAKTAEMMSERLKNKYGLIIPQFHPQWRTGDSQELREQEVQGWLNENGRDADTDYIAVDDDPINLPGVYHIRADYDGIMADQLMFLRYLQGFVKEKEYIGWRDFAASRRKNADDLICGQDCKCEPKEASL